MNRNAQSATRDIWKLALLGAAAAAAFGLACSTKTAQSEKPATKVEPVAYHPGVVKTVAAVSPLPVEPATVPVVKKDPSKLMIFRSRDYGVSFQYPWQFAYYSAQKIANSDDSLRPASDGHDGQFSLARIEVPRGYYPDTDLQTAYFVLSLNQNIGETDCTVTPAGKSTLHTETINGTDFHWVESGSGGHGSASRVRNYVAFVNGSCYEVEMGMTTSNQNGLAREVNSDQVFGRLESILKTVKIEPEMKDAPAQVQTATAVPQN